MTSGEKKGKNYGEKYLMLKPKNFEDRLWYFLEDFMEKP